MKMIVSGMNTRRATRLLILILLVMALTSSAASAGDFVYLDATSPTFKALHTSLITGTPVGITTDAAGDVVTVTAEGTVYSLSTKGAVLKSKTLPGSGKPVAITMNDGGDIYVAKGDGTIHHLNLGLSVLNTKTVTGTPVDITVAPDDYVYIATSGGTIHKRSSILAGSTSKTVTGTPTAIFANTIDSIFVATSGGTVYRLNALLAVQASGSVPGTPIDVAADTAGNTIVASDGSLYEIDDTTIAVGDSCSLGGTLIGVDLDYAGHVVAANSAGKVFVVKTSLSSYRSANTGLSLSAIATNLVGDIYAVGTSLVPSINVSPTSLSFGNVVEGNWDTEDFTIQNTGTASLTFSISSKNTMYTATPSSGTISAGGNQKVTVTFAPPTGTPAGSQPGNLTINSNDPNNPTETVSLTATVVAAVPSINVSPTTLPFGDVVEGNSDTEDFTIQNTGTASLTFSISSKNTMYTATPSSGTISAGGNQKVTVTFAPPAGTPAGSQPGKLTIGHNDTSKPDQFVSLSATVVAATRIINVAPSPLDFGKVGVNYSLTQVITVTNNGNSPLTVTKISSTNPRFELTQTFPFSLSPGGGAKPVQVTFSPTSAKDENGQLTFQSNATNANPTVDLKGEGVQPPKVDAYLVLDRSGSMAESAGGGLTKMDRLRSAVSLFIDLARAGQGDKLGIVQFDHPTTDYVTELSEITTSNKPTMKNKVNGLMPSGWTSIGKGLELAFNQLTDSGKSKASHRVLLLLSDGMENRPPFVDLANANGQPVYPIPTQPDIEIYTVGLGLAENMNSSLLSKLAFDSVGAKEGYFHLTQDEWYKLHKYFISIFSDAFDEYVVRDPVYHVGPEETVTIPATIVDSDKSATFIVYWTHRESQLLVELVAPDGTTITLGAADSLGVQYVWGDLYAFYRVSFLPPDGWAGEKNGEWTLKITGVEIPGGINKETVSVSVIVPSDLSFKPFLNKGVYSTGDVILLSTELLERGRPIKADEVRVTVNKPNEGLGNILSTHKLGDEDPVTQLRELGLNPDAISNPRLNKVAILQHEFQRSLIGYDDDTILLFDDGLHGDGSAGDGIWANFYTDTRVEGIYTFAVEASIRSRLNEATTREKTLSTAVAVNSIDPAKTTIHIDRVPIDVPGFIGYKVAIVPKDAFDNFAGPGYANLTSFRATDGEFVGLVDDDNAGEYSQVLHVPSTKDVDDIDIAVGIFDSRLTFNLGEELERQEEPGICISDWWWLVLIVVLLLLLAVLILIKVRGRISSSTSGL